MLSQQQFMQLITRIVKADCPDEIVPFELASSQLADALFSRNYLTSKEKASVSFGEFQFVSEGKSIVEFASIMIATYKILADSWQKFLQAQNPQPSPISFGSEWKHSLIEAGLRADKADRIVSDFLSDICQLMGVDNGKQTN